MATHEELRSVVVALRDEIDALADVENISAEDDLRLSVAIEEFDARSEELSAMELRATKVAEVRASHTETVTPPVANCVTRLSKSLRLTDPSWPLVNSTTSKSCFALTAMTLMEPALLVDF